jgi:hypothetical protein
VEEALRAMSKSVMLATPGGAQRAPRRGYQQRSRPSPAIQPAGCPLGVGFAIRCRGFSRRGTTLTWPWEALEVVAKSTNVDYTVD